MNKLFILATVLIVALGAVLGGVLGNSSAPATADSSVTTEKISGDYREALNVIDANYIGAIDHEKLADVSIQSMLWTLDPHSSFFTQEEFRKLNEDQQSQFYGIGVSIVQHRDGVYVQSVIPGTPADQAGVRYGDKFLAVDDKDASEWTSSEVSKNVRGTGGTTVQIKFGRAGQEQPVTINLVRGGVPYPSVRNYFMLSNGDGYVGLTGGFQETTAKELDEAVNSLKKQGMKNLVLDLRGNPGGLLPQAIEVVSRFVERGKTVVQIKAQRQGDNFRELRAVGGTYDNLPTVVLINGGSASASEIVSGALQDYGRALIVGTPSFGKGLVQRVFELPYKTGLTLTTARYYTPYGRSLQRDYSNGSIYDYYTHHDETEDADGNSDAPPKPAGSPVTTAGGRIFYGGRGVEPDYKVSALAFNQLRYRLSEAAFLFARQLAAGKVAGFENLRADKQDFNLNVAPNEFLIDGRLLDAFRNFTVSDQANGLTADNFNSQIDFAKSRLRMELATAHHSTEAGQQVLLETDPQVLKGIEVMPESKALYEKLSDQQ